jgi:hypothetical protein
MIIKLESAPTRYIRAYLTNAYTCDAGQAEDARPVHRRRKMGVGPAKPVHVAELLSLVAQAASAAVEAVRGRALQVNQPRLKRVAAALAVERGHGGSAPTDAAANRGATRCCRAATRSGATTASGWPAPTPSPLAQAIAAPRPLSA